MLKLQWLWFSALRISSAKKAALLARFSSVDAIYHATERELLASGLADEKQLRALCDKSLNEAGRILESCEKKDVKFITQQDVAYPDRLKNIYDSPPVLYYRGNLPAFDAEPVIAVVGSRSHTAYGRMAAEQLAYEIASGGGHVVSGMARGLDAAAHRGALRAGKSTTAVLGCGPDVIYPKENTELYEEIVFRGCVMSEYPPGTQPLAFHFPERNRIVSGLSVGVLVVEAGEKSGALITANLAADQGRDVFAVPGNIDVPKSAGTNNLIKTGAKLVSSGWDVLSEYEIIFPEIISEHPNSPVIVGKSLKDFTKDFTDLQMKIIVSIAKKPLNIDEIIEICGIAASEALAELTVLEIEGAVTQLPGKRFTSDIAV